MQNIFVVGATGLIGSHAAEAARNRGMVVSSLARTSAAAGKLAERGLNPVEGRLDDHDFMRAAIRQNDAIIFAPSLGAAETEAVERLLALFDGSGKTFVFTSGSGVLGERTSGAWSEATYGEDDSFRPMNALRERYGLEGMVRSAGERGFAGIVVRPPAVWCHERPHPIVTKVVESVQAVGQACYIGAGLNLYSHVHAADLGQTYALALEKGGTGAVYHAVAGEVPNRWIADVVARVMNCSTRSITLDEAIDLWGKRTALIIMSVSSRTRCPVARRDLGWVPAHTDMLAAAEASIRQHLTDKAGNFRADGDRRDRHLTQPN